MFLSSVANKTPVRSIWGNFKVSRSEFVARRQGRGSEGAPFAEAAIPLAFQLRLPEGTKDVMLAIARPALPLEINQWFKFTDLSNDLQAFCSGVAFCSFLEQSDGQKHQWSRGMVIEKKQPWASSPFGQADQDVAQLAGERFLADPYTTIFVNSVGSGPDTGGPKSEIKYHFGPEYLPPITHFLGYLKARAGLRESRIDPDHVRHELKTFYASAYELNAVKMLMDRLDRIKISTAQRLMADFCAKWFLLADQQTKSKAAALLPEERSILTQLSASPV